jgi:crotonobetainyl-CoA:carnitine CoA-transferase CaiB-like acyl-CoA transferase
MAEMHGRGPLLGVRVADFSVHAAGPFAGVMLAELGAEVIKIESAARLDITRRPHTMYEPIPLRCFPCYSALNFMRRASWLGHSKG